MSGDHHQLLRQVLYCKLTYGLEADGRLPIFTTLKPAQDIQAETKSNNNNNNNNNGLFRVAACKLD